MGGDGGGGVIVTARPGLGCGKIGAKKWDVGNPENSGMWDFQNIFRVSFIMNNYLLILYRAAPLVHLTSKNDAFVWSPEECQTAFEELRNALICDLAFAFLTAERHYFWMQIKFVQMPMISVLWCPQSITESGTEHVIAYFSRALWRSHCRYCTTKRRRCWADMGSITRQYSIHYYKKNVKILKTNYIFTLW